jgi:hypothetical protein
VRAFPRESDKGLERRRCLYEVLAGLSGGIQMKALFPLVAVRMGLDAVPGVKQEILVM